MQIDNNSRFSIPIIDVPATSQNLKNLRENNNITLAKLYKVTLDELIVIKQEESSTLAVNEGIPPYGIAKEILDFISINASNETKRALEKYYLVSLQYYLL